MGFDRSSKTDGVTGRIIEDRVSIYNVNTGSIIYNYGTFKY